MDPEPLTLQTSNLYALRDAEDLTFTDQPSATAWCMVSSSRWSSAASLIRRARTSGPRARSKGVAASLCMRAKTGSGSSSATSSGLRMDSPAQLLLHMHQCLVYCQHQSWFP